MRATADPQLQRLRQLELFAGLSDNDLRRVGRLVYEAVRPAGTTLMEQGSPGAEAFVIASGTVSVVRDGRELAQLGPGAVVGELALVDQAPRSATVVAETDMVVFVLSTRDFVQLLDECPTVGRRVIAQLGQRLRTVDASLTEASSALVP